MSRRDETAPPEPAAAAWLRPSQALGVAVVLGVVLVACAAVYYTWQRDRLLRGIEANLDAVARLKAEQIEQWQHERLSDARFLAAAGFVARDVEALVGQPASDTARRAVQDWLRLIKGGDRYASVQLIARDRRTLVALPEDAAGAGDDVTQLIARAFTSGEAILSDEHLVRGGAGAHLHLFAPVFASGATAPREPIAVVLFRIDPRRFLFPLLLRQPMPSASGESLIARRFGDEVVFLSPLRYAGRGEPLRLPRTSEAVAARVLREDFGVTEGIDYRGRPVLSATRPIAGLSWVLVAKLDRDEAYEELRQNFWVFAALLTALLGAVAGVVLYLWRQLQDEHWRVQSLQSLQANRLAKRLAAVMQQANDIILLLDRDGRVTEANERAVQTYGYSMDELRGLALASLSLGGESGAGEEIERFGTGVPFEVSHRAKDGHLLPLEGSGRRIRIEDEDMLLVVFRDLTARKRVEKELGYENRLYSALLQANEAALAAPDPAALGRAMCRALVSEAGLRLAWIGWVNEASKLVEVETVEGPAAPYVEGLIVSVDPERAESRGPTGRSLLQDEIIGCADFEVDERMALWRDRARRHGIRSSASIPIRDVAGGRTGALTVYAGEPNWFTPGIVRLLRQLSVDFAFGLRMMAARLEQDRLLSAVRESEQRYRSIFEDSHAVMLVVDPADGRILDANAAAADFYRWSREKLRGMGIQEINLGAPREIAAAMERVAADRSSARLRFTHLLADGSSREVAVYSGPVVLGGRRVLFSIVHDVSKQVKAEQRLADSERRFRRFFTANPQPLYVFELESLRFIDANDAALATYGYTRDEFLALKATDLREPEDADRMREELRRALASAVFRGVVRHRTKNGVHLQVEITARTIDYDGVPARLVLAVDVTERERIADRLQTQVAALDAADNAIAITDPTGTIEWVNEAFCRNTGYAREELVGRNPRVLKSGRHPPEFYAEMWATIRAGKVWRGEIRNRRKDGTDLYEDTTITPLRAADGAIVRFIAIKQDTTERKRLEQQQLRSQRMEGIGLLAGGIAHDLNNILTPIQIGVDLLRKRATDPKTVRTLEVLESSARRGAGIVRQVLTFARGVGGERMPLRPRDVVREIVSILEETFPRQIEIRREVPADLPPIVGDPSQLHQVLLNLAVNARDAMPDGGRLVFRAAETEVGEGATGYWGEVRPGHYVVLTVADSGSGMPPEVLEKIFAPFFTTKPQGRGTGLGLPTVLGIVRSHGGFIGVQSRPGEGTEFRIHLPAGPREEAGGAARTARSDLDGTGQTILVCDDEPMIRELVTALLQEARFRVIEASNGVEAVERFLAHKDEINGVVTDIMMPLKSGDRAVAEMLRVAPRLPIVFMSGLTEESAVLEAIEVAPQVGGRLLKKPFTDYELLAAIRDAGLGRPSPPQPPAV